MSAAQMGYRPQGLYIGGEWRPSRAGKTMRTINLQPGRCSARFPGLVRMMSPQPSQRRSAAQPSGAACRRQSALSVSNGLPPASPTTWTSWH